MAEPMYDITAHDPMGVHQYRLVIKAARLAVGGKLPPPIDPPFKLYSIPANLFGVFGLPERHKIAQMYPDLQPVYLAMVAEPHHFVMRGRVKGVALYLDWNRSSGLSTDIISVQGRALTAPWEWQQRDERGQPCPPDLDPSAVATIENRRIETTAGAVWWSNNIPHGVLAPTGADWLDGVPTKLETMYTPQGRVFQWVVVPDMPETKGMGIAEQTLVEQDRSDFLSIMVRFPRPSMASVAAKLMATPASTTRRSPATYGGSIEKGGSLGSPMRGDDTLGIPEATFEAIETPKMKFAVGDEITQAVTPDPMGPSFWSDRPAAMFVIVPITPQAEARYFSDPALNRLGLRPRY